jgi:putative endonuclease
MYVVYAIRSIERNFTYVGLTRDLEARLFRNNNGYERTTKPYVPFKLIYQEEQPDRISAREREKFLKSGKAENF